MKTCFSAITTTFCLVAFVCFIATWSVENADAATVESEVWAPLSVMRVTNPMNFGAVGNGAANDLPALTRAVDALGDGGGVVYLPPGRSFLKTAPLRISKSHIKLWSPNQQANIFGAIRTPNTQSVIFQNLQWGGVFGLRLRSNATSRGRTQLDHQVVSYNTTNFEVCGIEVNGSNAGGIFLHDGSSRMFVEGNVVRWTWADHIHHTGGVTWSWVWGNRLFNGLPSKGDDGVASVTYGTTNKRNRDLEWFENIVLGQTGARGYAVVGGDKVNIHHNWAISTQGAGIYIAAERGYNSSGSNDITINNNWLYRVAQNDTANHAGMMCFAGNRPDAPVQNVRFTNNVVVETKRGQAYRNPSGNVFNISNSNMVTDFSRLPTPMPTAADVKTKDTTVLRTRDTWFVAEQFRNGLYRIHVRVSPSNSSAFQQRFEYVVRGPVSVIRQLAQVHFARTSSCVLAYRNDTNGASANLVVLSSVPLNVDRTTGAVGVTFEQLRTGDRNGQHSWLWDLLDDPQAQKGTQCLPRRTRDSDDTDNEFY